MKVAPVNVELKFVFRPRNLLGLVTCPSRLKEEPLVLFLFVQEQQLGGLDEQHQPDPLQVGWYLHR